jgi:hypothetical protein
MQALRCKERKMVTSGKAKGGIARAAKLSPEERSQIASKAALARWSGDVLNAVCGSPDHPLKIGDLEIPCYVLEDGRRVLHQRGMVSALGMGRGGSSEGGGDRLAKFTAQTRLSKFVSERLLAVTKDPIKFRVPNGSIAYGYEATILADICDAVLAARKAGYLQKQQMHIADRCEILVRGFARVGIIALVDEATGYQELRAKEALSKILEAFIAKELQPWVKTFPDDFYKHLFRLRGLNYPHDSIRRPQYFGVLTNDMIYKRLAPGVLNELKRVTPQDDNGRPKHRYFQRLTSNVGYPKLREHLGSVVTLMKLSDEWREFMDKLDHIHPRFNSQLPMPLQYDAKQDSGQGI